MMIARETPLARLHEAAGAKLVQFAGWLLPLQFGPINEEVMNCRRAAALFDISHMGVITLRGPEAREGARATLTRDVTVVQDGRSVYALMCNEAGGILEDLVAMVETESLVRLIVNAANHDRDFLWLRSHLVNRQAALGDRMESSFGVALQGPRAEEILRRVMTEGEVPPYQFMHSWMKMVGVDLLGFAHRIHGRRRLRDLRPGGRGPGGVEGVVEGGKGVRPGSGRTGGPRYLSPGNGLSAVGAGHRCGDHAAGGGSAMGD